MKKKIITPNDIEMFQKHCELCNDPLPLNIHKGRRYCPEKYGVSDWCKQQMKGIREQQRLNGEQPITTVKASLANGAQQIKVEVNPREDHEPKPSVNANEINNGRDNNIAFLKHRIGDQDEVKINLKEMLLSNYDFKIFDYKEPFPDSNYFYNILGEYAIWWQDSQTIVLTKSILLTCLY